MTGSNMVSPLTIDVAGIEEDSIVDGPGLRFVLYVQGCPHHCAGCHNPQTHTFGNGTKYTIDELYSRIAANTLVSGITFSGGEPFCQADVLAELALRIRKIGLDIAVYTGFTFEHLIECSDPGVRRLMTAVDVIIDGRFVLARRDMFLPFRGSDNQRVLDASRSLYENRAVRLADENWFSIGEHVSL